MGGRLRAHAPGQPFAALRVALPRGRSLPDDAWAARHRGMLWLLWAHAPALTAVALGYGLGLMHALLIGAAVAVFGLLARVAPKGRRVQSLIVVLGLLSASALLVHATSGLIEAHFHFFVMVGAISLYEDWVPFGTAVAYVFLQHGAFATVVDHDSVFNHGGSAWTWSLVHSGAIAALSAALIVGWRMSERRRQEVAAAERRQRAIFNALEEGVLLVDRDGRVAAANPSARRLLAGGLSDGPAGAGGFDAPWDAIRPDGSPLEPDARPSRVAARTGRALLDTELGLRRPDGSVLWIRGSAIPLPDGPDDPGPYPVVLSFADITAARLDREALERSNADLRRFAYVASHDLSEPLRVVASYLQLLRRRYGHGRLGPDADEFIGHALSGAARMRALIDDLLSYSRAGRVSELRPVDCNDVVRDVLADLAVALEAAQASVHVGRLPTILADPLQIRQLFQNLLANAIKFRRGPGVHVWVQAERTAAGWSFEVADDGIGIPAPERERVFEMFQRLHHRETYEGTGIGLAICRRIVEQHGGAIVAAERPGGGTALRFTLPARPSAAAVPEIRERAAAAG